MGELVHDMETALYGASETPSQFESKVSWKHVLNLTKQNVLQDQS